MDSGAMVSMIPEMDLYLGKFHSITTSNNQSQIRLGREFNDNFLLVANLYRGCYLSIYTEGGVVLKDRVMIQSNGEISVTVNGSLDSDITTTPSNYYGVIEHFGAPVPAPKGTTASGADVEEVTKFTFDHTSSFALADFHEARITFKYVPSEDGTEDVLLRIGLEDVSGTGQGTFTGGTAVDHEVNISSDATEEDIVDSIIAQVTNSNFTLSKEGTGAGTKLVVTGTHSGDIDTDPTSSSSHITVETTTLGYTDGNPRLLSDTWLGLTESVQIPSTSVETKAIPISSGSRSMTYQFKGMETTSGGSLSLTANNFSWLYYALGNKEITSVGNEAAVTMDTGDNQEFLTTGLTNTNFIYDSTSATSKQAGFSRVEGNIVCPPLNPVLTQDSTGVKSVDTTTLTNKITYTFSESNSEDLPTFALEYTLKKPDKQSTVTTDVADVTINSVVRSISEDVYSKIYPGCMVSSLTLDASASQEVKMNVNFETKKTFVAPTSYETANGLTDVRDFVNFGSPQGGIANEDEILLRPFFFSDGTISMFGQDYIRIETMSLEINNSITPKRFVGRYDKTSQMHFPGQRTYNLSFTGLVTDSAVFDALRENQAFSLNGTDGNQITLRFTKEAGSTDESLEMVFQDYMVTTADFPLTNDKGPISVSWTIVPLKLKSCSHVTNWIIQG
tara:strand:- start:409 stop:2430 length:2022 start_codon:yes stop_codon:yes gene_type:complete